MIEMMRPILEIAVIIPGMLLAYLSVKACLRQTPFKLVLWMFPLLLGIAIKKAVSALAEYDTKLQARDIKESPAEVVVDDVVE